MAKAEWGTKHTCSSCSAKFYDMQRTELVCPKCGQKNQPQVVFKQRRATEAVKEAKPAPKAAAAEVDDEDVEDVNTDDDTLLDSDDDDDAGLDVVAAGPGDDDDDAIVPVEDEADVGLDSADEEEEDL